MTGPIKPPSSLPGSVARIAAPASKQGASMEELLRDRPSSVAEPICFPTPVSPLAGSALEDVIAELRAGRIRPEQVVESIVERALEGATAKSLAPVAREKLEAHLRQQLAEDPVLAGLTEELGKAR